MEKTLILANTGIAFIFPVRVKRLQTDKNITIKEKNSKNIGFILSYINGKIGKTKIKKMTLMETNIIKFNDDDSYNYNIDNPNSSFVKKLYFKKDYSPFNFWTKKRDEVVTRTKPDVFKCSKNSDDVMMKGGNLERIELNSSVYVNGDNKTFFYSFIIDYVVNGNGVEINSVTFNKKIGEYVEVEDLTQDGGGFFGRMLRSVLGIGKNSGNYVTQSPPSGSPPPPPPPRSSRGPLPRTPSGSSVSSGSAVSLTPPPLPPPRSSGSAGSFVSSGSQPSSFNRNNGSKFDRGDPYRRATHRRAIRRQKIEFQINTKNNYPEGCRAFFNILPPEFKKLFTCMIIQSKYKGEVDSNTGNINELIKNEYGTKFQYAMSQTNHTNNYVIYIDDNPVGPDGGEDRSTDKAYVREYSNNMSMVKLKSDKFGGITNYISTYISYVNFPKTEEAEKIGDNYIDEILFEIINKKKQSYQKIIVIFDFDCTLLYSHAFRTLMGISDVFNKDFLQYLSVDYYKKL